MSIYHHHHVNITIIPIESNVMLPNLFCYMCTFLPLQIKFTQMLTLDSTSRRCLLLIRDVEMMWCNLIKRWLCNHKMKDMCFVSLILVKLLVRSISHSPQNSKRASGLIKWTINSVTLLHIGRSSACQLINEFEIQYICYEFWRATNVETLNSLNLILCSTFETLTYLAVCSPIQLFPLSCCRHRNHAHTELDLQWADEFLTMTNFAHLTKLSLSV